MHVLSAFRVLSGASAVVARSSPNELFGIGRCAKAIQGFEIYATREYIASYDGLPQEFLCMKLTLCAIDTPAQPEEASTHTPSTFAAPARFSEPVLATECVNQHSTFNMFFLEFV